MAMSVQELRTYVRTFLDTDALDLPDELLDTFRIEATDQITKSSDRWSFYEQEFTFTTIDAQEEYPLHGSSGVADTLAWFYAVVGPRWELNQIGHQQARRRWAFSNSRTEPTHFSVWRDSIWLWPVPNGAYELTLIGYRKPVNATDAAGYPDVPDEFHPIIAKWMLGMAYQQQDDTSSSQILLSEASQQIENIRRRYETVQRGGPAVLGGVVPDPWPNTLGRLAYDWE